MNTEKPEPPEGMRIMTAEELKNPLPMDAMCWSSHINDWARSNRRGKLPTVFLFYATRTPIPSPEHNPDELPEMEEFRFLRVGERLESDDEAWIPTRKRWILSLNKGLKVHCGSPTYRRRVTPIPASEKPPESPEKDAEIARLREDYERLQNQLRLCEEHAGTMAVDFDKGVEVMRADITALRAQLTAKDAIIGELVGALSGLLKEAPNDHPDDTDRDRCPYCLAYKTASAALTRAKENQQ